MNCPEPMALDDLIGGRMSSPEIESVRRHLDSCSRCAERVAMAVSTHVTVTERKATAAPMVVPVETRFGRYEVRRWIGHGGMGDVYEGFDPKLHRRVALKVLRRQNEAGGNEAQRMGRGERPSLPARLEREARTLAQLSHPNVVAALDLGVSDRGEVFLVMELVEGPTLAAWLRAAPRGWREVLAVYLQAAEGLAAAHDLGVVHRDFKPQNVLMDVNGKPRVGDFGLARRFDVDDPGGQSTGDAASDSGRRPKMALADDQLTETGAMLGTPRYMAPEQFSRATVDMRTDQFSFAVALFEALYAVHPFAGADVGAGRWVVRRPVVAPRSKPWGRSRADSFIPSSIEAALRRGLAEAPKDRYPSLRALLTAVREAAAVRPRRGRRYALGLTMAAAVGLVGAKFAPWSTSHTAAEKAPALQPAGTPADWTSTPVLFHMAGRMFCMSLLSEKSVRVVWGEPRRVDDVDLATGAHHPAALVPESYRYGCPQLSPDGKQLIYEGYDAQDRPQIFHAANPSGRDAQAVVPCFEPSNDSQPLWLSSSREFVFDLSAQHPAVFSLDRKTFTIVTDDQRSNRSPQGFFKAVSHTGDIIAVIQPAEDRMETLINLYEWPSLEVQSRLRTAYAPDGRIRFGLNNDQLYTSVFGISLASMFFPLAKVDAHDGRATYVGRISGRHMLEYVPVDRKRALIASRLTVREAMYTDSRGLERLVPRAEFTDYTSAALLGNGKILLAVLGDKHLGMMLFDPADQSFRHLAQGQDDFGVSAPQKSGGADWLMVRELTNPWRFEILFCSLTSQGPPSCRHVGEMAVGTRPVISPLAQYFAYPAVVGQTTVLRLGLLAGGELADLAQGLSACAVQWSGSHTLWFSRRVGRAFEWTEIDVESKRETGRKSPGTSGCYYEDDPSAPAPDPVRIIRNTNTDLRIRPL